MYKLRHAESSDALAIAIVTVYTWKTAYSGLMPDALIDNRIASLRDVATTVRTRIEETGSYWIAESDGCVVGFCCLGPSRDTFYEAAGEIYALYVLTGFQGLGIGGALFSAARKELADKGYSEFVVNCLVGNSASDFYTKQGGDFHRIRTDRYGDTDVDESVFVFSV